MTRVRLEKQTTKFKKGAGGKDSKGNDQNPALREKKSLVIAEGSLNRGEKYHERTEISAMQTFGARKMPGIGKEKKTLIKGTDRGTFTELTAK